MPNALATLMLVIWPIVTLVLFMKLPPGRALIVSILSAYLFLPPNPAAMDFPLLPPLNKETLPLLSVLFVYLFVSVRDPRFITMAEVVRSIIGGVIALPITVVRLVRHSISVLGLPDGTLGKVFAIFFVAGPAITVFNNAEPLIFRVAAIRGLYFFDIIALTLVQVLLVIGYLMARRFLSETKDQRDLLFAFLIGGLLYTLPILIEARMSPQMNVWVYGYFQHAFEQTIRANGYRPVVFLNHGIWVAFFVMTALVATVTLLKAQPTGKRTGLALVAITFIGLLIVSKTLGSLLIAGVLLPLIWFLSARKQIFLAVLLGLASLSYPALKTANLVPQEFLLERANALSPARAQSLKFRFDNEDILLERAMEKPLFGWGSWGRNQIRDDFDGQIESVSDGRWIITLGMYGWVGFIGEFGLLFLPIFVIWRETRRLKDEELSPYVGPMTLLLGANMIDLLPNATLTHLTWLLAGTLLGYAESLRRKRLEREFAHLPAGAAGLAIAKPLI